MTFNGLEGEEVGMNELTSPLYFVSFTVLSNEDVSSMVLIS